MSADPGPDVVWCDFGGVLTPPLDEAFAAVEEAFGVPWVELLAAAERVARKGGSRGLELLETGALSQSDWAAGVTAELRGGLPRGSLADFGEAWYAGRVSVEPAMIELLRRVRATGVRVGLLTNSVREWEPLRRPLLEPVADVFDAQVRSHEIGVAKPDPAIFEAADGRLPPARRALLIDDLVTNCEAARAHGWIAVHHIDPRRTARALAIAIPALTAV